jgi:hypothetical protein
LEQAIDQRGFAVVDVSDDCDIADIQIRHRSVFLFLQHSPRRKAARILGTRVLARAIMADATGTVA